MFNFSNRDLASTARCRPAFADRRVILERKSNYVILLLAAILCAENLYVKKMIKKIFGHLIKHILDSWSKKTFAGNFRPNESLILEHIIFST
jgi:hypothetical protein